MGGEKGVLVVEGTDLEGKIREGEPAASRREWQAVEKYRPHSPLGAPAGEEGPLRLSSLLVLGLLASGGAQGQSGLFVPPWRSGPVGDRWAQGRRRPLPHHYALRGTAGGQGEGGGAAIYPQAWLELRVVLKSFVKRIADRVRH